MARTRASRTVRSLTSPPLLPRRPLFGERGVQVVEALGAVRVLAAVLVPMDGGELGAQYAGGHEGADVEAHAVVQVGLPAEGLLGERLPAHVDVVRRLTLKLSLIHISEPT